MFKKTMQTVGLIAACALLFVVLPGCPKLQGGGCDGFVDGQAYEVVLQIQGGDVLYAVEAELVADGDECEQEGDNEGDNEGCDADADSDDDADADSDDDADTDADDEEEGDAEGDEAGYQIAAQVTAIADDLSGFELLGALTVVLEDDAEAEVAIADLAIGAWVEVEGDFEDGVLEAEKIELADDEEINIEGALSGLTDTSFTMAGLTITYDDATVIDCGGADSEEEDDDDGEGDDDD
jgi:hypothetical protein